ncbi:hypothetical protein [Modestobacter italicus]|uniref:hypothetical protein n=1 Tax=Modestobacter italicus (strain DSM 44449 / CECT 9708 / BC 501) TaxID=2732864 RepID=UPI001C9404BE|nr:hypothetical protein [Modestobacter italicus]
MISPPDDHRARSAFVRTYGYICVVGAVIGVAATAWALTWDPGTAVVFAVLTVLLLPAYLLVRRRAGSRSR